MENCRIYAKMTLAIIIIGVISLILFTIFGLPLLTTNHPVYFRFDDLLLAELAIFGTIIFIFWIWTKILRYIN